jgi:glycosyltransferase involved in cell wall biosynthesis
VRPILLNTYDQIGGAARAAYRLHRGLLAVGVDSRLLVQRKVSDDPTVHGPEGLLGRAIARTRPRLDSIPLWSYRRKQGGPFSPAILPDGLARRVAALGGDLVHLHWVAGGFLHPSTPAALGKPVVWTLHDSWAFTGGCHVPGACTRYRENCGGCPVLGSSREDDLSRRTLERKRRAWSRWTPTLVTPGRWLAAAARSSALFREASVEVIPNGLDLVLYQPVERGAARDVLGLPPDRFLLLFGGVGSLADPNKGFSVLVDALARLRLPPQSPGVELVVVGAGRPEPPPALAVPARFVGPIADEASMALYHAAADALVLPSLQENHPNMAIEAMACGTPTVAFRAAGLPDVVEHLATGFLAEPYESEDLALGIAWVLEGETRRRLLRESARRRAERDHEIEAVARRYQAVYARLLGSP